MEKVPYCIFVGGPMQNAVSVENRFNPEVRLLIEKVLNILEKNQYNILSAHRYENYGEMDVSGKYEQVCSRDYNWMNACDLFAAVLPLDSNGDVICSSGTSVELGWASAKGKPIILIRDVAPKYSHLVAGLNAVTRVAEVYINEKEGAEFEKVFCNAIGQLLNCGE